MPKSFRTLVPLLALLAACGPNDAVTGAAMLDADAPAQNVGRTNGDVAGIEAVITAATAAWDAKDAVAYAALYAEDVDFIAPTAMVISGRAGIQSQHTFLFGPAGPFRASTQTIALRRVVFLTGTIAIVDLDVRLTGFIGLPPGLNSWMPGIVRNQVRWVAVKRGGDWQIVAQQMTPFPPA